MRRKARTMLAGLLLLASCGDLPTPPAATAPDRASMNQVAYVTLCCGGTLYVNSVASYWVAVYDQFGHSYTTQNATWTSSNPYVASVAGGQVQANHPGYAQITATVAGQSASITLQVLALPVVTTVQISQSSVSLNLGHAQPLTARAFDQYGSQMSGQTATWSTGNSAVATVSSTGLVTGVGVGSTTVTATIAGKTASVPVTVQNLLTVGISGPTTVFSAGGYDWTASPTGGSGNYTYRWWVDYGGSQQYEHGTGDTAGLYISEYDPTFIALIVEVTSGTQTATASIGVCNFIASAAC